MFTTNVKKMRLENRMAKLMMKPVENVNLIRKVKREMKGM